MLKQAFFKTCINTSMLRYAVAVRFLQQSRVPGPSSSKNPVPPSALQELEVKDDKPIIPSEMISAHYRAVKAVGPDKPNSVLEIFNTDRNIAASVITFFNSIDLRPIAVEKWFYRKIDADRIKSQRVIPARLLILGPDLAAAHFLVYRGASVRFEDQTKWIKAAKGEDVPESDLPIVYTEGYRVEAIDATGILLVYEGLEVLRNLRHLKWLSLSQCPLMDDWCLDRIAGEYRDTLEYLDISNCEFVTERGIAALSKLKNLRHLRIGGHKYAQNLELTCLYLEDIFPNIIIEGVDYFLPSLLPREELQLLTSNGNSK